MSEVTFAITFRDVERRTLQQLADEQGMTESRLLRQALRLYQSDHRAAMRGERRAYLDENGSIIPNDVGCLS